MRTALTKKHANQIAYWHGGGYDGCIWEPNMGFVDDDRKWHPVISTGRGAIDDVETLREAILELNLVRKGKIEEDDWKRRFSYFRLMPLNQESIDWLCDNVRIDYVAHFVDKIADVTGTLYDMKCTECGAHFHSDRTYRDNVDMCRQAGYYTGDGGIGVVTTAILCDDCFYENVERIKEGDWIYVFGCAELPATARKSRTFEVKRVTEDGNFIVAVGTDADGNDIEHEIDCEYCEKTY